MKITTPKITSSRWFQEIARDGVWAASGLLAMQGIDEARAARSLLPPARASTRPLGDEHQAAACYVGYIASKKVGNAVRRNRAKRRMRELVRHLLPHNYRDGWSYVIVARRATPVVSWSLLQRDFIRLLSQLHTRSRRRSTAIRARRAVAAG